MSPADELLAEHHLATGVILAMAEGADRLVEGKTLPAFWGGVVEFIGNFVHLVHREKETCCFATGIDGGWLERRVSASLQREHEVAKRTTLELIEAVRRGDPGATCQHVSHYAYLMLPHMEHEERTLIEGMRSIEPRAQASLRAAFKEVERAAMRGRNRKYYLDLAQRICSNAGVEHPL